MNSVFAFPHQHPLYPSVPTHTHTTLNFRRYGHPNARSQHQYHHHKHHPQSPSTNKPSSEDVKLQIRQQPKEALVTADGKEKARKPVDPPPIVQCHISSSADPGQHFLQSPYLFMCASLHRPKDDVADDLGNNALAGSLVSSLHRLKDHNNKDGGFFVFGDISIKVQGTFCLKFSLFDLHKETNEVQFLTSVYTEPFKVLPAKDFKGMEESTYLSRAFSDQGVRLRLRKEPRALMSGSKRGFYQRDEMAVSAPAPSGEYSYHETSKRFRQDAEDRKENFSNPGVSEPSYAPSYAATSQYPSRQPSLSYNMPQYSSQSYTPLAVSSTTAGSSYQLQGSLPNPSTYFTSPMLPSSTSGVLHSPQHQRYNQHLDYSQMYSPSYSQQRTTPSSTLALPDDQHRNTTSSSIAFLDDNAGLGGYRSLGTAFGDEHRPTTATGITPSLGLMGQPHHTPQRSHEVLATPRGSSYSQSPEDLRSGGYASGMPHLGGSRSVAHFDTNQESHSSDRLEDPSAISSVYQSQRNAYQGSMSDPNLASHTDAGVLLPSNIPYTPDMSHSTVPHNTDSV